MYEISPLYGTRWDRTLPDVRFSPERTLDPLGAGPASPQQASTRLMDSVRLAKISAPRSKRLYGVPTPLETRPQVSTPLPLLLSTSGGRPGLARILGLPLASPYPHLARDAHRQTDQNILRRHTDIQVHNTYSCSTPFAPY